MEAIIAAMTDDGRLPSSPEAVADMMDRFNALSYEERGRILGLSGPPASPWQSLSVGMDLPPAPPVPADLDHRACSAGILGTFETVRDFVGEGRKLTAKGNLTRADAVTLGGLLADPALDLHEGTGRSIRSADELAHTQLALRWARAAGALRVTGAKMAATATWARLTPSARVHRAATALLRKGPLTLWHGDWQWAPHALHQVLEEGLPHIVALLWAVPEPVEYEAVLEAAVQACETMLSWGPASTEDFRESMCRHGLDEVFELLGRTGVAERAGTETVPVPAWRGTRDEQRGGTVALTPLGRAVLGGYLAEQGFTVPEPAVTAGQPLTELLARIGEWSADRIRVEFDHWVAAHSPAQAAAALGEALRDGYPSAEWPMAILDLAGRLPRAEEEMAVRAVLATPARGHAIAWLVERALPDVPDDPEAMITAGIEMLALAASAGDDDKFEELIVGLDDPAALIADCQQAPGGAGLQVLRAIGRAHPDPEVARAARLAAMRRASVPGRAVPRKRDHRSRRRRR